jgi:hypothetical protein
MDLPDIASTPPDRPHRRWELILGEDAWRNFRRWRRWREIVGRVPSDRGEKEPLHLVPPGPGGAFILKTRIPAVSSTEIRTAIANGPFRGPVAGGRRLRVSLKTEVFYSMRSNNSSHFERKSSARSRARRALHSQSGGSLGQRIGPLRPRGRPGPWRNGLDCFTIWPKNGPPLG